MRWRGNGGDLPVAAYGPYRLDVRIDPRSCLVFACGRGDRGKLLHAAHPRSPILFHDEAGLNPGARSHWMTRPQTSDRGLGLSLCRAARPSRDQIKKKERMCWD